MRARYAGGRLARCTPSSLKSVTALLRELEEVRTQGYAVSAGESESEIAAIAVPVPGPQRVPLGAISISMPMTRYDDGARRRVLAASRTMVTQASGSFAQAVGSSSRA